MIETSPNVFTQTFLHEGGDKLILWHHGTPAPRQFSPQMAELFASYGYTVAIPVRQGYLNSTVVGKRSVSEDNHVSQAVVDYLGFSEFKTIGYSGGGSRALADLALLDNCVSGMAVAALAPTTIKDLDLFAEASQEERDQVNLVRAWPENIEEKFIEMSKEILSSDPMAGFADADEDTKAWLNSPDAEFRFQQRDLGVADGVKGWILDEYALMHDYGFDVSTIKKPLKIITGDKDSSVIVSGCIWLNQQVADSELIILEGMGHSRVFAIDILDDVLADF